MPIYCKEFYHISICGTISKWTQTLQHQYYCGSENNTLESSVGIETTYMVPLKLRNNVFDKYNIWNHILNFHCWLLYQAYRPYRWAYEINKIRITVNQKFVDGVVFLSRNLVNLNLERISSLGCTEKNLHVQGQIKTNNVCSNGVISPMSLFIRPIYTNVYYTKLLTL